ncbi:MAG: SpoIIE family protein phosphatase [Thermoflexales bacterium]|nr:SpoIIE family protein phosphatase [Thermoflexales bacterium]
MLDLKDFFHLPQLDVLVEQLVMEEAGLVIVAGMPPAFGEDFVPSSRSTIFRILMRQILTSRPGAAGAPARALVVARDKGVARLPRSLNRQVEWALITPPYTYAGRIAAAAQRHAGVVVVDQLDVESAVAALEAAGRGLLVLAQLDTALCGAGVAFHLRDMGVPDELLSHLRWVVTVQHVATLCPHCKQACQPDAACLAELGRRYPDVPLAGEFFQSPGCAACRHSGRLGSLAAFDVFRRPPGTAGCFDQPSRLPLDEYILHLALAGHVPLDDVLSFRAAQLYRLYRLFTSGEQSRIESSATLERKLVQLEAAHHVLEHQAEALISLQGISQTLVTATELDDLAARVCRCTRDLCSAERAILYFLQADGTVEILAVHGWDPALLHQRLDAGRVMGVGGAAAASAEPAPFNASPPGVVESVRMKAGLRVPLIAQNEVVGLMIVHTSHKAGFTPGEVAMLQAFTNQAAVALQRAGLIEALRDKIAQLEAAQVELVKKERLERELELARQVQQRLLPLTFPLVPGFAFAARCLPARQVGGDFYDVISLDADCFGVVIADVSDKGMPAALFMALTRSLLLAEARRERSPQAVLTNVHRLLAELGQPNMFVTVFYGVVDVSRRQMTYTRAGHDRPLLLRNGLAQAMGGEGAFLGLLEADELHLSEEQVVLVPGDRLVLYTDGLVDSLSPAGRPFELSRLIASLCSHASLPASELCTATLADLAAYQGTAEQYDDMAMLVVEVQA